MSEQATPEVQMENEHFRVTKWTIQPGGVIPMHRHEFEYVVVPMVTDTMTVVSPDGSVADTYLEAGKSYSRPAGAEHQVENRTSSQDIVFVEVEKL